MGLTVRWVDDQGSADVVDGRRPASTYYVLQTRRSAHSVTYPTRAT